MLSVIGTVALGVTMALLYVVYDTQYKPKLLPPTQPKSNTVPSKKVAEIVYSSPRKLIIPKIYVDAQIEQMGLTEAGDMESPNNNEDVGWYKYSPHPGNMGSAVIAGHLGVREQSVFINLANLKPGDGLTIIDAKSREIKFTVRESRRYNRQERPEEVFNSSSGSHLNLITCAGTWDEARKTYSQRLVVFTDRN